MSSTTPNAFAGACIGSTDAQSSQSALQCGQDRPQPGRMTRIHPDGGLSPLVYLLKQDDRLYLVHPNLMVQLREDPAIAQYKLYYSQNESGRVFYWAVRASSNGNSWYESAHLCARKAMERPLRIVASIPNKRYETREGGKWPNEVSWPARGLEALLSEAFNEFIISNLNDTLLEALIPKR